MKVIKTSQVSEVASKAAEAVLKQRRSISGSVEAKASASPFPPIIVGLLSKQDNR